MKCGKIVDFVVEEVDELRNFLKTCTELKPKEAASVEDYIGEWEKNLISKFVDTFEGIEKSGSKKEVER